MVIKYILQYDTDGISDPFNIRLDTDLDMSDITTTVGGVEVSLYLSEEDIKDLNEDGYCFDAKQMGERLRTYFFINEYPNFIKDVNGNMGLFNQVQIAVQIFRNHKLGKLLDES
jgi:hypothetical protein